MAAPAYNQYKKGSTDTALKSELSNLVKAYNAKNAVEASYCHTLANVGFTQDGSTPLYAKKAFMGFGAIATSVDQDCGAGVDVAQISIKTDDNLLGSCSGGNSVGTEDMATCGVAPNTGTWTPDADRAYSGNTADCRLGEGAFYAGATTAVSALNVHYTTNEDGVVVQQSGDPNTLGCNDSPDGKFVDLGGVAPSAL